MERFARIAGTVERRYSDGLELIDDPEVEAVVVVAPTRFHRDLIVAVAEAGKPLFTEKPLAPTYDVVREIVERLTSSAIPAQVGFQSRFHPLMRKARELVRDAPYGRPMGYSLRSCDILVWLFGPVRRVYASTRRVFGYDVEDVAALTLEHENGVVGNLLTVFNGVQHREERRLEIFLEQAAVESTTDFLVGARADSFLVHPASEREATVLDVDVLRRETFAREGFDPDRTVHVYQYFAHHAFASAVRAGSAPSPDVNDALRAHQVVEAAYRSADRRTPVELTELQGERAAG